MEIVEVDTTDVTLSCAVAGQGPVVIAVHGFPDCRSTFFPILPALADHTVVMPSLRGYAPSGIAASGRHDAMAAGYDILRLADHFSPGAPVKLIGHDWGAFAAFRAVTTAPERFSHLVTMGVPHPAAMTRGLSPAQVQRSWYVGMFQLPWIGEARLKKDGLALIDRLWRDWSPGYSPSAAELSEVKAGIRDRVKPVLGYYRAMAATLAHQDPVRVPAIHLHGVDDGSVGLECTGGAESFYAAGYALHAIRGAGHFMTREKPDEVGRIVADFFRAT